MKTRLALQAVVLLSLSIGSLAAEVEYQHPNLTIVAKDELLDSVLKSISKQMRIFVKTPTGINPVVNCDIQNQPIKLALKQLLGDMSYSLEWKDNGERLVGLTILTGTGGADPTAASDSKSGTPILDDAASLASTDQGSKVAQMQEYNAEMLAEREALIEAEREERKAQIGQRRQKERTAHEARMAEEVLRNEAEMAEYFADQGLPNPN
jgi:hypothetical protein